MKKLLFIFSFIFMFMSCSPYKEVATFPSPDKVFITSGDGDIQKPYTPIGQLIYLNQGARIPLPLFGLIPINDIDPDIEIRKAISEEVTRRGGNGLINMRVNFEAPKNGLLGLGARGGHIFVTGTIIRM